MRVTVFSITVAIVGVVYLFGTEDLYLWKLRHEKSNERIIRFRIEIFKIPIKINMYKVFYKMYL